MVTESEVRGLYPDSITSSLAHGKLPYSVTFSQEPPRQEELFVFLSDNFDIFEEVSDFGYFPGRSWGAYALHFDIISSIIDEFGMENVIDIQCPINQSQIDLMKSDRSIIVQPKLYLGRYRYSANPFLEKRDTWKDILYFCDRCFDVNDVFIPRQFRKWTFSTDHTPIPVESGIFLEKEVDYMALRMAYGNKVEVTKIVTHDEIRSLENARDAEFG